MNYTRPVVQNDSFRKKTKNKPKAKQNQNKTLMPSKEKAKNN